METHFPSIIHQSVSISVCHFLISMTSRNTAQVDGLMLDPDHPRKEADPATKIALQRDFAECLQQISLFAPGCAALKASSAAAVVDALDTLVDKAWCGKRLYLYNAETFECYKRLFYRDRLGTNIGKVEKRGGFRRSEEARDCARGALMQLCPERTAKQHETSSPAEIDQEHIMMSCKSVFPASGDGHQVMAMALCMCVCVYVCASECMDVF
jgi:hypothetical protein